MAGYRETSTWDSIAGMSPSDLLDALELLAVDRLRAALDAGLDPCAPVQGKAPIRWLTEMYSRGSGFAPCMRLLLERGAVLDDPVLAPVLCDDAAAMTRALREDPALLQHRTTLVCAFAPLEGASLLHVAAEYCHEKVARVLIAMGADVEAPAAIDAHGLNGHTPIFHTVNSAFNRAQPIMQLLLAAGARTDVFLPGLCWGRGFEWETTFLDVTPISFAQLGLLPQIHRNEQDIYENIRLLLHASGRAAPPFSNIPNRYLSADEV